jgi:electron transport complex protein RnfC
MIEYPRPILNGINIVKQCLNIKKCIIAIEDNKEDAVATMKSVCRGSDIEITELKTKYPQGGEKQLIKSVLGREVLPNKHPTDIGCLVLNVDTIASIYRAINTKMPLTKRIITVAGTRVLHSHNLIVRIGTPIKDLFEHCGGFTKEPRKVLVGGPMMGIAIDNLDYPCIKNTLGVLAFGIKDDHIYKGKPCIRCGKCISVCPMNLMPNYYELYGKRDMLKECEDLNVFDCIECGSCAYICPSRIYLVETIRDIKEKLKAKEEGRI